MSIEIKIELSESAKAILAKMEAFPERRNQAIARGLNNANEVTKTNWIEANRLTGQGPFPVELHRLGIGRSAIGGHLRESVSRTPAQIRGNQIYSAIGSNKKYAAIHEFGSGNMTRTSKPGKVKLRLDRRGGLVRQLKNKNLAVFAKSTGKLYKEVGFEGGKTFKINIPARAPFGHGIADAIDAGVYSNAIEKSLREEWEKPA